MCEGARVLALEAIHAAVGFFLFLRGGGVWLGRSHQSGALVSYPTFDATGVYKSWYP